MHPIQVNAELHALAEHFKNELTEFERRSGFIISKISITRFDKSDANQIKGVSIYARIEDD